MGTGNEVGGGGERREEDSGEENWLESRSLLEPVVPQAGEVILCVPSGAFQKV